MTGADGDRSDDDRPPTTLFESYPDPVLACERTSDPDADGRVVRDVNPAFAAAFAVERDGVVGTPLDDVALTGVSDAGGDDARGREVSDPPTAGSLLGRARDGDAPVVPYRREAGDEARRFRVRSVSDESVPGRGYLVFDDVTALERRRAEVAAALADLERVASVASHDIRNPLEVANIRLEAARETGEDVHFEKVAGALDRVDALVRDVLAVGGEGVDPTDAVALGAVAAAAWDTVETGDAVLVVDEELPTVRGDADRLRRLFENLFRNSVEHGSTSSRASPDDTAERADGAVTVTVAPDADGFVVADDGPGVPANARERVFEAGYSTGSENSGLGLSIVRRIARGHGWRVTVADDGDGGARFRFTGVERLAGDDADESGVGDPSDGAGE